MIGASHVGFVQAGETDPAFKVVAIPEVWLSLARARTEDSVPASSQRHIAMGSDISMAEIPIERHDFPFPSTGHGSGLLLKNCLSRT